jgi:hypothetical protein
MERGAVRLGNLNWLVEFRPYPNPLPLAGEGVPSAPLPPAGEGVPSAPLPLAGEGVLISKDQP